MKYMRLFLDHIPFMAGVALLVCAAAIVGCSSSTSGEDTYAITGKITDSAGNPVSGVTVSLTGEATKSTTSDANGLYSISGLSDGNYVVTPSKSGGVFTPSSRSVLVNGDGVMDINFTISVFILKLNPVSASINGVGGSTQVAVVAEMAAGVISARFTIAFDPTLVQVTTIKTSGSGYLFTDDGANVIPGEASIDNTNGKVIIGVLGQKQGFTGANGDGILATITFTSKRTGSGTLVFVNDNELDLYIGIYDENAASGFKEMTAPTQNGTITVQ